MMNNKTKFLSLIGTIIILGGCATTMESNKSADAEPVAVTASGKTGQSTTSKTLSGDLSVSKKTAVEAMRDGGTYRYVDARDRSEPMKATSSAALQKHFMGRHIDELPEATTTRKAVQDPNEVVCEVVERTHTRLRAKKVCATRQEWDRHRDVAKEITRNKQTVGFEGD